MRKLIAIILAIILVFPLLLSAQVTVSAASWALDRQFYIDTLDEPKIYSTLTSGHLIDKLLHEQLGLPLEVDTTELESILQDLLTTEYLSSQVDRFVNDYFDYLQGESEAFAPTLDLIPIKTALDSSEQDAFLDALVAALPTCTPDQKPSFEVGNLILCKPDGVLFNLLADTLLKPMMPMIMGAIPDEIPLEDEFQDWQVSDRLDTFTPGMAFPANIILGIVVLVFIAIFAWYVTALISDASWHVRLKWLGWMLLVPAVLIFMLSLATQSGIPTYWIRFGLDRANLSGTPFGPELNVALNTISASALPRVASAFQMVGGICGALAIALIFWGIATPRKKREETE